MKTILILLLPLLSIGQDKKWNKPFISKNDIVIYSLQAISGASSGLGDVLNYHPHTFERIYPNSNLDWWLPMRSQGNGGWVMTRDGIHMARGFEHTANYVSIGFSFSDFKNIPKKQWIWLGLKRTVISYAVNRLAFNGVYRYWFNDHIERQRAGLDGPD